MTAKTRRTRSPRGGRMRRLGGWAWRWLAAAWRDARRQVRPWRPEVAIDVSGRRGRRLRRAVTRAARGHLRALGVAPPGHLLIVVQRTVTSEQLPLEALLQLFENEAGERRHVLFLALSVGGRVVRDGELIATLRQHLQSVAAGQLGEMRLRVAQEPAAARPPSEPAAAPEERPVFPVDGEPELAPVLVHPNGAFGAPIDVLER